MYLDFNNTQMGPLWGPNFIEAAYDTNGESFTVQIFPDIMNDELGQSGKPLYFYMMPSTVRMAKDDKGKYMFHFTKFLGVLTEDSNIATKGQEEVAGGVLSLSSTMRLPDGVPDNLKTQLLDEIKKSTKYNSHDLFGRYINRVPSVELGFVPIEYNELAISNVTMNDISDSTKEQAQAADDKWLWRMQGEGKGNIDPNGTNACSAMLGQFPAALIEAGFHGDTAPLYIHNGLTLKFWMPPTTITVEADYQKIYDAYSKNRKFTSDTATGNPLFYNKADIQREFEENNIIGMCKVKIVMGNEVVDDKQEKIYLDMAEEAKKTIMDNITKFMFDPQPKQVEKAEAEKTGSVKRVVKAEKASWSFSLGSGLSRNHTTTYADEASDEGTSYALNSSFDKNTINLGSQTEIVKPVTKDTVISGNMKGFFQDIQKTPDAEKEYFDSVNLGNAFKKIHVIATSRANWPDEQGNGDLLDKLALEVGYPDGNGGIYYYTTGRYYDNLTKTLSTNFNPAIWTKDCKDRVFVFDIALDSSLPKEQRNQIYIKRTVTFKEDPRVKVNADNEIVIDDEVTTDTQIEVKANVIGHLNVGPFYLAADLNKHMLVEVTCKKDGFDPTTMMFTLDNTDEKQKFELWTNESTTSIPWSYKVKVAYKSFGPLEALEYESDDIAMTGSYPHGVTINMPAPPSDLLSKLKEYKTQARELELLDA